MSDKSEMARKKPKDSSDGPAAAATDERNKEGKQTSQNLKVEELAVPVMSTVVATTREGNTRSSEQEDDERSHRSSPRDSPASKKYSPCVESSENKSLLTPIMSKASISNHSLLLCQHQSIKTLDLESALYKMTLLSPKEHDKKEYLVEPCIQEERDDSVGSKPSPALWINFRLAHMGDASALAALYCKRSSQSSSEQPQQQQQTFNQNEEQISLWLADGLGDEDTPPSVYGLICEVHQEDDKVSHELGAAVLLTAAWQNDEKVIRIEWYMIKPEHPNIEGHLFLRLAALAIWTDSALVWVQSPLLGDASSSKSSSSAKSTTRLKTPPPTTTRS